MLNYFIVSYFIWFSKITFFTTPSIPPDIHRDKLFFKGEDCFPSIKRGLRGVSFINYFHLFIFLMLNYFVSQASFDAIDI